MPSHYYDDEYDDEPYQSEPPYDYEVGLTPEETAALAPPDSVWNYETGQWDSVGQAPAAAGGGGGDGGTPEPDGLATLAQFPELPDFNLPDAPAFTFTYPEFTAPTLAQAQQEPGFAFARDEGLGALQRAAAARGVLRTGGSLKDLSAWANRFADQNYGNVFNRALGAYGTNFNSQFGIARQEYLSRYNPWEVAAGIQARQYELEVQRLRDQYLADLERERDLFGAGAEPEPA